MSGLEPLVVVALVGNILQFTVTIKHMLSTTREILDSGAKGDYLVLQSAAEEWRRRADEIDVPEGNANEPLRRLTLQCRDTADELLAVLSDLKTSNNGKSRLQSLGLALRSHWKESQIDALRTKLNTIAQTVSARLADERDLRLQANINELLGTAHRFEMPRREELAELKQLTLQIQALSARVHDLQGTDDKDIERLAAKVNKVAMNGRQYSAEQQILRDIHFERLEDRYSLISSAHQDTLGWLFGKGTNSTTSSTTATFAQWLESNANLYWVSGLPGSGKSTLMKYLYTNDLTKECLSRWAQGNKVIIAEYFFWNAGKNDLQKSQEGLLRALIYQFLRNSPDCMSQIFPGAYSLYNGSEQGSHRSKDALPYDIPFDINGLIQVIQRTCNMLAQSQKRFCFFLDGLDEYSGDVAHLISLVALLRALEHVKICVSSRPWPKFEEAYGETRTAKFLMHQLNGGDIAAYVNDVFVKDRKYQELQDAETQGKELVEDIVASANGVFLWVVLVVRSLQDGLCEGDGIGRLQERLTALPQKLEELFERILFQDVEITHRERAARMFLVTLKAKDNLPLMAYWFLDELEVPTQRQPLRIQQTIHRHGMAKRKLGANCKGLLEARFRSSTSQLPSAILFEYRVDFLHRTVRDYLELPTTNLHIWAPSGFNVDEAICQIVFSQIKTAPYGKEYAPYVLSLYEVFEHHAKVVRDRARVRGFIAELPSILSEYEIRFVWKAAVEDTGDPKKATDPLPGKHSDEENIAGSSPVAKSAGYQSSSSRSSRVKNLLRKIVGTKGGTASTGAE